MQLAPNAPVRVPVPTSRSLFLARRKSRAGSFKGKRMVLL